MSYALGVLILAVGLLVSIALHEVGHLVPAKKFGVKVTQYMVGFGPTVWSRHRGDTEYGLKAIPLGGYIRMIGMVPPKQEGTRSRWPRRLATSVEDFRQLSRAEVQPGDEDREFYRLTPGKKMIIMCGGPTMNLLIYLVLTVILFTTMGNLHSDPTTKIASIVRCVVPATSTQTDPNTCSPDQQAPALGKLQPGDRVVAVNGTAVTSWDQLVSMVEPSAGKALDIVVDRNGTRQDVVVTPAENVKYVNGTSGPTKTVGFLGVSPASHVYFKPLGITAVPGQIGHQLRQGVDALGSYPQKIGSLYDTVFHNKQRDPNGAIGVIGIGRLGGDLAASNALDAQQKIYTFVGLVATLNLLLFLLNMLPLLPLDGGHVAGALYEAAKRGRARLRARRVPTVVGGDRAARPQIFVDTAQMLPVLYGVASLLIVLSVFIAFADIVKPIHLGG